MRISDWSSDVCSSDLVRHQRSQPVELAWQQRLVAHPPDHQRRLGDGWEGRVEEGGAISGGARFGHVDRAGAIPVEHCRHRARLTPLIEMDELFGRHFRGIGMRWEAAYEKCRPSYMIELLFESGIVDGAAILVFH